MKTNIETLAAFISAAIWADGKFEESEKVAAQEIAEAMEIDEAAFLAAIDAEYAKLEKLNDEEAVTDFLYKAGEAVDDDEIGPVFECAMEVVLADGVLGYDETANLLIMAEALGIEHEYAMLMLADMVKEEPELEVNFED